MRYYADILGAILPCISDKEEKIRVVSLVPFPEWWKLQVSYATFHSLCVFFFGLHKVARETNEELRSIHVEPSDGFDVGAILSAARRLVFFPMPLFGPSECCHCSPDFVTCEFLQLQAAIKRSWGYPNWSLELDINTFEQASYWGEESSSLWHQSFFKSLLLFVAL